MPPWRRWPRLSACASEPARIGPACSPACCFPLPCCPPACFPACAWVGVQHCLPQPCDGALPCRDAEGLVARYSRPDRQLEVCEVRKRDSGAGRAATTVAAAAACRGLVMHSGLGSGLPADDACTLEPLHSLPHYCMPHHHSISPAASVPLFDCPSKSMLHPLECFCAAGVWPVHAVHGQRGAEAGPHRGQAVPR